MTETKGARTRSAIIDAALRLFREKGYDATTMRAIATEAGVSVGNAYYYFDSKEQLIQGFYDRPNSSTNSLPDRRSTPSGTSPPASPA